MASNCVYKNKTADSKGWLGSHLDKVASLVLWEGLTTSPHRKEMVAVVWVSD